MTAGVGGFAKRLSVRLLILAPLFAWLGSETARAETLSLVTGPDYKPFTDPSLAEGGLATELVRAAFASQGVDVSITWMDWKAGFDATVQGAFAATFPYFRAPEREQIYWYSEPIFVVVHRLFFRSDRTPPPAQVEDIAGSRVCIPTGYHPDPVLLPMVEGGRLTLEQPLDMTRCFELLALGRVDFVATNEMQGWELVDRTPGLSRANVAISRFPSATRTLSLIAPKSRADALATIARFNAGLVSLVQSGRYAEIVARHLGADRVSEVSPTDALIGRAVVLERRDGRRIEGTLTQIGQGVYQIKTAAGVVEVATGEIRLLARQELLATGPAAPAAATPPASAVTEAAPAGDAVLRIVSSQVFTETVAPAWIEAFARSLGATDVVFEDSDGGVQRIALEGAPPGSPAAIELVTTSTEAGIAAFLAGRADVLLAERPLADEERARARAAGLAVDREDVENVLALDGVVLLVHPSRALRRMSRSTAAAIFRGEIQTWQALGQAGGTIVALALDPRSETARFFRERVLGDASFRSDLRSFASGDEILSELLSNTEALAFTSVGKAQGAKVLALDECGSERWPTAFDVETEDYPLVRRLYLYVSPAAAGPAAGAFAEFVLGRSGQELAHGSGFTELRVREAELDEQARLLALRRSQPVQSAATARAFFELARVARRLTVTFRFRTASSELDVRAERDLRRLAAWIRDRNLVPRRVVLAGFADGRGDYGANLELSRRRALRVAEALAGEGIRGVETVGFGEEFPVACDHDPLGWERNRRVEVWLR
ncbi:MAG: hypothetical protein KatS3mg082_2475 [Nitrospiraceae bacterium]|nr:MAG: hypothetical protein KatS3mg082_2475 [Nitrospiraceae bacterium]